MSHFRHEIPSDTPEEVMQSIKILHDFLAIRNVELTDESLECIDLVVLCGNAVLDTAEITATVMQIRPTVPVIVTGGFGHSTASLHDAIASCRKNLVAMSGGEFTSMPEAEVLSCYLKFLGIHPDRITTEDRSTNCGANAEHAAAIAAEKFPHVTNILLIQDPTMQRRSWMCFEKFFTPDRFPAIKAIKNFTPTHEEMLERLPYSFKHYIALLLGEIPRLRNDERGYGPSGAGFIGACEIPAAVERAFSIVQDYFPNSQRPIKI